MNDSAATLDHLVAKSGQLYSLPAVAIKVLELTDNPLVDARGLKQCIENDPALTGKILRVVNSSLFGLSRKVSDLNQAIALLGTKPLKLLVLGFSLPDKLFADVHGNILAQYWRHTLTKAVAARELSETVFHIPGDDAFIAGLLQDIGVLVLIRELGEPYVKFLEKVIAAGKDPAALETELIGFDHTMLSAKLLAQWGLPEVLVDAVDWNAACDDHTLPRIVRLAELLARLLADRQSDVLERLLTLGQSYGNLSEEQLDLLVGNLEEKVRNLADVLSLQLPDGLDYSTVLAQAHEQLSDVAAEAAEDLLEGMHGNVQNNTSPCDEESLLAEFEGLSRAIAAVAQPGSKSTESAETDLLHVEGACVEPCPAAGNPTCHLNSTSAVAAAEPGLSHQIAVAVAACRQSRCPLSLLLIELDRADRLMGSLSNNGFRELMRLFKSVCRGVDHPCAICLQHGEVGFALILPDCERRAAVALGNHLVSEIRSSAAVVDNAEATVTVSVGAATVSLPPKNFQGDDLLAGAERCLYGSQASGGEVVKSIEIY